MSGIAIIFFTLLLQDTPCEGDGAARASAATARAAAFDLDRAAEMFAAAAAFGCDGTDVTAHYLRGLVAARAAYAQGGSPESLAPVRQAIAAIEERGGTVPGSAEIARFVLMAAAAAAQSERDEMALLIEHAIRLEALQMTAKQPGAPILTAHEVAGDLWLRVHRYEEAGRAYARAAGRVGPTPPVRLGLARVASRIQDVATACREYRALIDSWRGTDGDPAEIREAHMFVQSSCGSPD